MDNPITIAGTLMDAYHVCAFFDSRDQEYDALIPYYRQAIENAEKNFHIVDPAHVEDHRERLEAGGIDTQHCEACGQLEVVTWPQAYLGEDGKFDKDRMLGMVEHLTGTGRDMGFSRLRIMGNMDWAFEDFETAPELIAYEAEVNEIIERNRQPAVCVYDMAKLSGAMLMDVLRTHPLTLINGIVQENPFFIPPSEMLKELEARKSRASA